MTIRLHTNYVCQASVLTDRIGHTYRVLAFVVDDQTGYEKILVRALTGPDKGGRLLVFAPGVFDRLFVEKVEEVQAT